MLIPCIDLQRGRAVQLVHGRKLELAVANVLGLLERFSEYERLHVIDLDAAMRKGHNNRLVKQLCVEARRKYKIKIRVGGGIRTVRRATALTRLGVEQIIVGSAAFRYGGLNLKFLKNLVSKIGRKRILLALDTSKSRVVIHGWRTKLSVEPAEVFSAL
jgi:phosphoribosyl-AMP cyclohydrolase / phosphoribosyl-ATP pyrophosphohydrolase